MFFMGAILFSTMALLPPFLHGLPGYPVIDVGTLLVPRGVGTMAAVFAVGRAATSGRRPGRATSWMAAAGRDHEKQSPSRPSAFALVPSRSLA